MPDQVAAHIVLRTSSGDSVVEADTAITSDSVRGYDTDPQAVAQVRAWLESHGFRVESVSPHSISISGLKEQYERVFQVRLRPQRSSYAADSTQATYEPEPTPTFPDDIAELVSAIVFPRPPELF